ncbi:MAG: GNAT family N-acetyltransferase [Chthoniobacterales bacterium]
MNVTLRPGTAADAERCGEICYNAFKAVADQHNFPPDFPSQEVTRGLLARLLASPDFYSVVAEFDGTIVGSNFVDERSTIAGLGPITVDPAVQNRAVGRQLMQNALDRVKLRAFPGVRLLQAAYHNRSLSLYARLGFVAREPLSTMQGPALGVHIPGYRTRPATELDLGTCNEICAKVHGHDRAGELRNAIKETTATVVEHAGRIVGYSSSIAFFGHAVAETNEGLKALIGAAPAFGGPGFLVPTRNAELFLWCLERGLQVVQPMTLMSIGLYNEPAGAFLPSILY